MSALPQVSGREVVNALRKAGYEFDHQLAATSSSATLIRRIAESLYPTTSEVAKGTLRAILRQAGLSVNEFKRLL